MYETALSRLHAHVGKASADCDGSYNSSYDIGLTSEDRASGYAVQPDGELVYVFSLTPGRGDFIVASAIHHGSVYLDCFDGYLPTLYGRHGFLVVDRVANWTPGLPDVVYMALEGFESRHGFRL